MTSPKLRYSYTLQPHKANTMEVHGGLYKYFLLAVSLMCGRVEDETRLSNLNYSTHIASFCDR